MRWSCGASSAPGFVGFIAAYAMISSSSCQTRGKPKKGILRRKLDRDETLTLDPVKGQ